MGRNLVIHDENWLFLVNMGDIFHITFHIEIMGNQNSANTGFDEMLQWITDRAFRDTTMDFGLRHLTDDEKHSIDLTIVRTMETNRRIETKLLAMGLEDENILDVLNY